jgi:hypothetical protein
MGKLTISMAIFNSYFDITRPGSWYLRVLCLTWSTGLGLTGLWFHQVEEKYRNHFRRAARVLGKMGYKINNQVELDSYTPISPV